MGQEEFLGFAEISGMLGYWSIPLFITGVDPSTELPRSIEVILKAAGISMGILGVVWFWS